jgi:hypothetical protein
MKWSPLLAAGVVGSLFGQAQAAPSFCTGTTNTVVSGASVPASFLLTAGNCVEAGDKVFGGFSSNGAITGNGSSSFTFLMTPGNVTLGFSGVVGPSAVGGIAYTVAVDPALSQGFLIDDLEKDFTFNSILTGLPASASLTGSTTASNFAFDCTRTVNPSTSTCPQTAVFAAISQMTVTETITAGPNAVVTALTDTISQAVPEPASLVMLGSSLILLGFAAHRRSQH